MIEGWKETTLGEVAEICGGFAFKGEHFSETQGFPVVKITDIKPPYVDTESCQKIDISQYDKKRIEKFLLRKGNYLVAMTGATIGKVGKITSDIEAYLNQRVAKIDSIDGLSDKDFIYYLVFSENFTKFIQGFSSGSSVQQNISSTDIGKYEILLPPLSEQRAIAAVLSSFDDKIELLRRQNKTLEAIAQAIFKEWFVKFKVKGEQLKLNPKTGLPEGWKSGRIKDCGEIVCGKTPPKAINEYFGGSIPFIKIPDMHNEMFIVKTEDSLTEEGSDFQRNKFIPANSVCVSCIATVGLVSITSQKSQTNQQINTIIPNSDEYLEYLYFVLKNMTNDLIAIGSGGSATLNINTGVFSDIEIVLPSDDILKSYHSTVEPLFVKVLSNMIQIQTLSKLRDTLLPKLMKGEIRVKREE